MRSKLRTSESELDFCPYSPIVDDYVRSVFYDDDGNEVIKFVKTDYPSIQASHGNVSDWSIDALLKAGVNPDFGIQTGFTTRLNGLAQLQLAVDYGNALADEIEKGVESNNDSE